MIWQCCNRATSKVVQSTPSLRYRICLVPIPISYNLLLITDSNRIKRSLINNFQLTLSFQPFQYSIITHQLMHTTNINSSYAIDVLLKACTFVRNYIPQIPIEILLTLPLSYIIDKRDSAIIIRELSINIINLVELLKLIKKFVLAFLSMIIKQRAETIFMVHFLNKENSFLARVILT